MTKFHVSNYTRAFTLGWAAAHTVYAGNPDVGILIQNLTATTRQIADDVTEFFSGITISIAIIGSKITGFAFFAASRSPSLPAIWFAKMEIGD